MTGGCDTIATAALPVTLALDAPLTGAIATGHDRYCCFVVIDVLA
jgi:hypothetical protein